MFSDVSIGSFQLSFIIFLRWATCICQLIRQGGIFLVLYGISSLHSTLVFKLIARSDIYTGMQMAVRTQWLCSCRVHFFFPNMRIPQDYSGAPRCSSTARLPAVAQALSSAVAPALAASSCRPPCRRRYRELLGSRGGAIVTARCVQPRRVRGTGGVVALFSGYRKIGTAF